MRTAPALVTPKDVRFGVISLALHLAGGMALLWSSGMPLPSRPSLPGPSFQLVAAPQPIAAPPLPQVVPPTSPVSKAKAKAKPAKPVLAQTPTANPVAAPVAQEPAIASAAQAAPAVASPAANSGPVVDDFQRVSYLDRSLPLYPISARKRGIEGRVLLHVDIDPMGLPTLIKLAKSSGSEALDKAAMEAVRQWKFKPARRGHHALAASVTIPIHFKLDGTVVADAQ
ncbi:putative Protein tonB2 [Rhodospirillaceae bacterium LM-1]|nr:putative Protein tonB2 [Rhodospirillaceae bacterium LM-1]